MAHNTIERMTLREKLNEAEKLTRELIDHIEHGFIPKAQQLQRLAKKGKNDEEGIHISDMSIRENAAQLLESERFTEEVYEKVSRFLVAIDKEMTEIIEGE